LLIALAGEVKAQLTKLLIHVVERHQQARLQVTEEVVDTFMAVRPMTAALKSSRRGPRLV
jgi:hypothetical protein